MATVTDTLATTSNVATILKFPHEGKYRENHTYPFLNRFVIFACCFQDCIEPIVRPPMRSFIHRPIRDHLPGVPFVI
jgi:hypothetical protein